MSWRQRSSRRLRSILQAILDFIFGYDYFISYAHKDGEHYPSRLRERLEKRYRVFLDQEVYVAGDDLGRATRRRVRMSRKMIVILRPNTLLSRWVAREVRTCVEFGRIPVAIDVNKTFESADAGHELIKLLTRDRLRIGEDIDDPDGEPSEETLSKLDKSFDATRQETKRLRVFSILAAAFAILALVAFWQFLVAREQTRKAIRQEAIAVGNRLYADAERSFAEARRAEAIWDREKQRELDLLSDPGPLLPGELLDVQETLAGLEREARDHRLEGTRTLEEADKQWESIRAAGWLDGEQIPRRPEPPQLFSVEVLSVGSGESLIIHYGDPDHPRFLLIDGGEYRSFEETVLPRLNAIKEQWAPGHSLPLELAIVSDQDRNHVEGLIAFLDSLGSASDGDSEASLGVQGIWFNSFRTAEPMNHRMYLRHQIEQLRIPLNEPFDSLVMRPDLGRADVVLDGGLTMTVLNPDRSSLEDLWELWANSAASMGEGVWIESFPEETFAQVDIASADDAFEDTNWPDRNAYQERSISNLASIVVLYQFGGQRFLHCGDARGDQILDGLAAAGLITREGTFHVDLMLVPHRGSDKNVTPDFFRRVTADRYLFTGDGRYDNPDPSTVGMILDARGDAEFSLLFLNRTGSHDLYLKLNEFFASREPGRMNYSLIVRSSQREVLTVDLLERVRY